MNYTELQVTTNFTFLRGASHPEEIVDYAISLGYKEIGITDHNTIAGVVRAHTAAKKQNIRIIVGARLNLLDGPSLLAYPTNMQAYSRLSNLLTTGNLRAEKGDCHLYKQDVYDHAEGMKLIVVPPDTLNDAFQFDNAFEGSLVEYKKAFGEHLYIAVSRRYGGDDSKQLYRLAQLSELFQIPIVATNDVHYHEPARRQVQDIVTCVREKCTIYNAGFTLHPNAERYLKPKEEMVRLFRQYPDAITCTQEIAEACTFSLDELRYEYPEEITSEGRTPQEELTHLAWQGARDYYGEAIPAKILTAIRHELRFIEEMNYAPYFLTVYDIVRYARSKGILCQGRGSAANSTVCYVLGITSVDPEKFDLLFERFISAARNEPPDIDVDFEHERREEVMQYIYAKYGRDRAAIVSTVTQQHFKGAIRDVGKAMGLSLDAVGRLAESVWQSEEGLSDAQLIEQGFNPLDKHLQKTLQLTGEFMGFPRQLGQHTGGFVITKGTLSDLCPLFNARMENRTCMEWNKDDIDALGFMKIDVLGLGMLTCIRKGFELIKAHYGLELTLATVPQDDPAVYDMICRADTIGVFQIESRAQHAMLPHLKPRTFYDLVIEVAIVRPGPIHGDMVHPYMRRRRGEEAVDYPSKELEEILSRTLGVPLFQEQAMKIAIVAAGFTPAEADTLRRSMATFKLKGMVSQFQEKITQGMLKNGYTLEYAQRVFRQLEGFGAYGFPESHAASFAQLVYVSAWIKCYYPDVFACALLNSMPMGFYQPAQVISDAQRHGVEVRPVDINYSLWDNQLEEKGEKYFALRLGFRQVKGVRAVAVELLLEKRGQGYRSIEALRDAGFSKTFLEKIADADCFRSLGLDRREALWKLSELDFSIAMFQGQLSGDHAHVGLPVMTLPEHVVQDYASTSLSLKAHPVSFVRPKLEQLRIVRAKDLIHLANGIRVKVAGIVLVRQRPETAKGVCFMTLEDETGFSNVIVFPQIFEQYRKAILQSRLIMVEGKLQREGDVVHVIASACHDFSKFLRTLTGPCMDTNQSLQLDFNGESKKENAKNVVPKGRNFH